MFVSAGAARLAVGVALLIVAAAGCGGDDAADPTTSAGAPATTSSPIDSTVPDSTLPAGEPYDQRRSLSEAYKAVPEAPLVGIDSGEQDGARFIAFVLREPSGTSTRVTFDWYTGALLTTEPAETPPLALGGVPELSAENALNQAFGSVSHGVVLRLTLTGTEAEPVWSVDLTSTSGPQTMEIPAGAITPTGSTTAASATTTPIPTTSAGPATASPATTSPATASPATTSPATTS